MAVVCGGVNKEKTPGRYRPCCCCDGGREGGPGRISELSHAMLGCKNSSVCYHKGILSLTHTARFMVAEWRPLATVGN